MMKLFHEITKNYGFCNSNLLEKKMSHLDSPNSHVVHTSPYDRRTVS